jgi:hypothetical protein
MSENKIEEPNSDLRLYLALSLSELISQDRGEDSRFCWIRDQRGQILTYGDDFLSCCELDCNFLKAISVIDRRGDFLILNEEIKMRSDCFLINGEAKTKRGIKRVEESRIESFCWK